MALRSLGGTNRVAEIHATCVALRRDGRWEALLLRGAPGSGKTRLAQTVLSASPAGSSRLIGDDRVVVTRRGRTLHAAAPARAVDALGRRLLGLTLPRDRSARRHMQMRTTRLTAVIVTESGGRGRRHATLLGIPLPVHEIAPAAFEARRRRHSRHPIDIYRMCSAGRRCINLSSSLLRPPRAGVDGRTSVERRGMVRSRSAVAKRTVGARGCLSAFAKRADRRHRIGGRIARGDAR